MFNTVFLQKICKAFSMLERYATVPCSYKHVSTLMLLKSFKHNVKGGTIRDRTILSNRCDCSSDNAASRPLSENSCEEAAEYVTRHESAFRRYFFFTHVRQPGKCAFSTGSTEPLQTALPGHHRAVACMSLRPTFSEPRCAYPKKQNYGKMFSASRMVVSDNILTLHSPCKECDLQTLKFPVGVR